MKRVNLNFKKDRYSKARGGYSRFLNIYCSYCKKFLLLYQKDGPGILKRLYMDRIFSPPELTDLQKKNYKEDLICIYCKNIIGFPTIYEKENRKSFHLRQGTFFKKIVSKSSLNS